MEDGLDRRPTVLGIGTLSYPSPMGRGHRYDYFDNETDLHEILLISHSLALTHLVPSRALRPFSERTNLILFLFRGRGQPRWFPMKEQVGLFLVARATSHTGLHHFSAWYMEDVCRTVVGILRARQIRRLIHERREVLGCLCLNCHETWLERGWTCPWRTA